MRYLTVKDLKEFIALSEQHHGVGKFDHYKIHFLNMHDDEDRPGANLTTSVEWDCYDEAEGSVLALIHEGTV